MALAEALAEARTQIARLQAALEVSQKAMARSSVEGLRDKDELLAQKVLLTLLALPVQKYKY